MGGPGCNLCIFLHARVPCACHEPRCTGQSGGLRQCSCPGTRSGLGGESPAEGWAHWCSLPEYCGTVVVYLCFMHRYLGTLGWHDLTHLTLAVTAHRVTRVRQAPRSLRQRRPAGTAQRQWHRWVRVRGAPRFNEAHAMLQGHEHEKLPLPLCSCDYFPTPFSYTASINAMQARCGTWCLPKPHVLAALAMPVRFSTWGPPTPMCLPASAGYRLSPGSGGLHFHCAVPSCGPGILPGT